MTVDEVRASVEAIRSMDDDEAQHGNEDALHQEVLEVIAAGAPDSAALAAEALKTREIKFARWCA